MRVQITFKHLDQSLNLEEYTKEKLTKTGRFLLKDAFAHVYFSKFRGRFKAEISMNTKERYLRGSGMAGDIYQAIDEAMDKIQKQLLKIRKVNKHHKKPHLSKEGKLKSLNTQLEYSWPYRKAA